MKNQNNMKKALLIIAVIASAITASGQTTKPKPQTTTSPTQPKYYYYVKLDVQAYNILFNASNICRQLIPYSPTLSGDEKASNQIQIDKTLAWLSKNVKVDSVAVKQPPTKDKP